MVRMGGQVTKNIWIVDDDSDTASLLAEVLCRKGFGASSLGSATECLERLSGEIPDIVIMDIQMPGMSGIDLCRELRERHPDLLPMVITGQGNLDSAISAMRAGAYDFITKPVTVDVLVTRISRALDYLDLRREVVTMRAGVHGALDRMIGESRAIQETVDMVQRVAGSDATVLISGESGTGKELVARALHELSPRQHQPFVAVNCAAIPASLFESELFGHVRGAFTDARQPRTGLFIQAGCGTMFLDEIGEMPIEIQSKLLRVLQERSLRPVGRDSEVPFEARVVASTNRDLQVEVQNHRFREDLFYRINVVPITVAPLRERGGDVLLLARHFLRRIAIRVNKPVSGITIPAARLMTAYDWPGNVRELDNCIERAVALCRFDKITVDDLPAKLRGGEHPVVTHEVSPAELVSLAEMERRYVSHVLGAVGGNKTRAARALGMNRRSLYRRLPSGGSSD
jgi:two-component system response regulator HydG